MHTKNFALDSGREVFAIPGPINNPMSEGTNGIIKRGNGVCVTEPDDILKYSDTASAHIFYPQVVRNYSLT